MGEYFTANIRWWGLQRQTELESARLPGVSLWDAHRRDQCPGRLVALGDLLITDMARWRDTTCALRILR